MAQPIVKVTIDVGAGARAIELNPAKLPLIFLEALEEMQDNKGWRKLRRGIQIMLKLTDEEAEALDTEHMQLISDAIASAQKIPNA